MSEQLIDSYVDRAAIEKETAFLVSKLEEVHNVFTKINGLKIQLQGANSFVQIADSISKVKKEETEFIKIQSQIEQSYARKQKALDEVQKAELALIKTYEKRQANTSDIAKDLAEEKLLLAEQAKQMKDNAKEALGMVSAYEKLQKQFMDAAKEAKDIGAIFGTNSQKYKDAAAKAAELNDKLKSIDGGIGNFQRNVGNYAGSLSPALESVKKELEQIRTQLKQTGLSANEIDKLNKNAALLEKVLAGVDVAAKSTKQEMRSFTEAAKQIGLEFGIASKEFQEFIKEVGSKKDELGDIQAAIDFQASDTKYLDGTIQAVSGLAGAYGAAEGASVLFGGAGEEVQQVMAKLQATIAITTGLQEVLKTIQLEGAAAQTFLAAKTSLLTAAETINSKAKALLLGTTTATIVATETQAATSQAAAIASSEQAVAQEAVSVTNVEVATTGTAAATAMGAEALATEGATAATYSFAAALTATGIGAIVIALAAGLVYLIKQIGAEAEAARLSDETNAALADTMKELLDIETKISEIRNISSKSRISALEAEAVKMKASGVTAMQSFAIDKNIASEKKKLADEEAKRNKVTDKSVEDSKKMLASQELAYASLIRKKKAYIEQQKSLGEEANADDDKNYVAAEKKAKADLIFAQATFDRKNEILQNQKESEKQIALLNTEEAKLSADEQRKLTLETTKIEAGLVIDKNSRILSSEKSTQEQRLAAIKSNAAELKRIAIAENAAIQNDPTQSNEAKTIAQKSLNAQLQKISKDSQESILKTNEDFEKRKLAAQQSIQKIASDEIIKQNEKTFNDENLSYDKRLEAFKSYQENKKAQIDAEYEYQKRLNDFNGATKEERELLEADHQAKLTALLADGTAKQIDIQISSYQKATNDIEKEFNKQQQIIETANARVLANNSRAYSSDVIVLNEQLQKGEISLKKYREERKRLDEGFNKQSLIDTGNYLKEQLSNLQQQQGQSLADRDKYIQEYNKLLIKPQKSVDEIDKQAKLKSAIDGYKDYGKQIADIDKQIADNQKQLSDENVRLQLEAQEKIRDAYKAIGAEIVDLFKTIVTAGYQNELNAIQDNIDALENKKAKDIEVAEQTSVNEQEKADKIKIIEAKSQSEKERLEQRKRQIQMEQARFEKAFNIAGIIFNTSKAVIAALAPPPVGLGPVAGVPLAVATGVLGAVQLAKAIATPLPKYKDGVESHPGGYAIVGDGGKQEVVIEPTGNIYLTPNTPTLMDLPAQTKVLPSVEDMTRIALLAATPTLKNFDGETMNNYELIGEVRKLNSRIGSVEKAIKNKKETHFNVTRWGLLAMQQEDQNQWNYLNENLRF